MPAPREPSSGAAPGDPFADAFWRKDLALLVALLAEPGTPEELPARTVFGDLVRLVNCEPLPPVLSAETSPVRDLRQLIRLEHARRVRLGAKAATSRTLWRDILSPTFFNRSLGLGPEGNLLLWPVESERWPGEALRARVRPSGCGAAPPRGGPTELELASDALLVNLLREGAASYSLDAAATRLAYHRAVLLARAGQAPPAKEAARSVRPEKLEPGLVRYGRLLRLELGVDPPAGYAALVGEKFGKNQPAVDERLAYGLHRSERWKELRQVTATQRALAPAALCGPGTSSLPRDLLYRHAVALDRLGESAELEAVIAQAFPACAAVAEPSVDALRDLALTRYARRPLDASLQAKMKDLDLPQRLPRNVQRLGARALHAGNLTAAEQVMGWLTGERIATARVRGWVLEAEIAFAVQDVKRFDRAVSSIFPDPSADTLRPRERDERDRAVEELAQSLVTVAEDKASADFHRRLRDVLPAMRDRAALRREPSFNALLAALESRPVPVSPPEEPGAGRAGARRSSRKRPMAEVAVGEVPVAVQAEVLPPPPVQIDWPEPFSLLAIPPPPGSVLAEHGAWFASATEGDDGTN